MKSLLLSLICFVFVISLFSIPHAFAGCIADIQGEINPQTAVSNGHLYNIYTLITGCVSAGVFFKTSNDNGTTFSPQIEISNITGSGGYPVITASGNDVYITWQEYSPNREVLFSKSKDYGVTFGKPVLVGQDLGCCPDHMKIMTSGNYIEIIWSNYNWKFNTRQALLSVSTDRGSSFENPINLSNETEDSAVAKIQQSGNTTSVYMDIFGKCPNGAKGCFHNNELVTFDISDPLHTHELIISESTVPEFPLALVVLLTSISLIIFLRVKHMKAQIPEYWMM
jgi:hypothetical protein